MTSLSAAVRLASLRFQRWIINCEPYSWSGHSLATHALWTPRMLLQPESAPRRDRRGLDQLILNATTLAVVGETVHFEFPSWRFSLSRCTKSQVLIQYSPVGSKCSGSELFILTNFIQILNKKILIKICQIISANFSAAASSSCIERYYNGIDCKRRTNFQYKPVGSNVSGPILSVLNINNLIK